MKVRNTAEQNSQSGWKGLYYIGGVAAILAILFFRRNTGVELVTFNGFGIFDVPETYPVSAAGWFTVLQEFRIAGLVMLGLVDLINYGLVGLIFLALYGALRSTSNGLMMAALIFGFVGITLFFATNQAFTLLALSDQYAAAATETEQAMFLASAIRLRTIPVDLVHSYCCRSFPPRRENAVITTKTPRLKKTILCLRALAVKLSSS